MKQINLNPKGKKTGDCVIRAIAYATNQSWDKVYKDLCDIGFKMKMLPNEKRVWTKYLKELGWEKQNCPRRPDGYKYHINEFLKECMWSGLMIVHARKHLTVIDGNELVDTWDCSSGLMGNYWVKDKL